MKKKKVLIIAANDMGNSGVPNVYMQIVRNLSDKYIFDILITREDYYFKDEFLLYDGNIFLYKERIYKNKIKRIWWRLFGNKSYTKKALRTILKKNRYEVIHSFKEGESWLYLKIGAKYGIKNRIIHNNRVIEKSRNLFINLYNGLARRKSIKYSTNNISVSKLSGKSFFKNHHFEVVYNSYNENLFPYLENEPSTLSIIQVGTFLPLKNQIFTLKVLVLIKKKYPDIQCYFVGKKYDLSYYNKFNEEVKKYNLEKNVKIFNFDIDQRKLLKDVIACFVPSISEGLSLVSVEAQACGIKVFASSGVPSEVDLGNISYLDLIPEIWTKEFINYVENGQYRKKVDTSRFSTLNFINTIDDIYRK